MGQNYETIFQAAQYYPSLMAVLAYGQRFLPSMVFLLPLYSQGQGTILTLFRCP